MRYAWLTWIGFLALSMFLNILFFWRPFNFDVGVWGDVSIGLVVLPLPGLILVQIILWITNAIE